MPNCPRKDTRHAIVQRYAAAFLSFLPRIFLKNQFQSKPVWPLPGISLVAKVAIVTGANSGLGLEASDQLLSLGLSHLVIAVRSIDKGNVAARGLREKYPDAAIDVLSLDMSSYDSIRAFAKQAEQFERLDIVILNAGVRNMKRVVSKNTGHEETIQVNYLSTVLLCILLLPIIKHKAVNGIGRMTMVGSGLALAAKFANRKAAPLLPSFDGIKDFDTVDQYNTSKLLGLMFLDRLADYVSPDDIIVNVVDPGFVKDTGLSRDLSFVVSLFMAGFKKVTARSVSVGASTYIDAAVLKGKESHGCYVMSWKISPYVCRYLCYDFRFWSIAYCAQICRAAVHHRRKSSDREAVARDARRVTICRCATYSR